jgi:8-oxo-dGTP pyrophosphatase MutT (NUDIX family)
MAPGERLRRALLEYAPSDAREAEHRARMLELLLSPGAFSRAHFLPGHFTASAFVLSPARDALLLILHKKLGLWLQPGGHVEPEDVSLGAAARREVLEEVGIELPAHAEPALFDVDVHTIPPHKLDPAHEHFDVRYCFVAPQLEFLASSEVVRAEWVPLAGIERRTSDASVLRAVEKLRGRAQQDARKPL